MPVCEKVADWLVERLAAKELNVKWKVLLVIKVRRAPAPGRAVPHA